MYAPFGRDLDYIQYYDQIIGKTAVTDIKKGTPMSWNLIDPGEY